MPRQYRPREVIRVLESAGWRYSRQVGSHFIMNRDGSRNNVSVPLSSREMVRKTLGNVLRQAEMTRSEFNRRADDVL